MYKNKIRYIDIEETHIRYISDILNTNLEDYIKKISNDLKKYIYENPNYLSSLEPIGKNVESEAEIIRLMDKGSVIGNVGPMACVAGTISQMCLNHLIIKGTKLSSLENGGDIAVINNKKLVCGIYSNTIKNIGFKLKPRSKPLGIFTYSAKIGHSISFGNSESVTIIGPEASVCDALATSIANDVTGESDEESMMRGLESAEKYREFFDGGLITIGGLVGTIGKLPEIVTTEDFDIDY